mgnify:CR=1 FL=1
MASDLACCTERRYAGLQRAARLFAALGDETRLAIVRQLAERGRVCACDLGACCAVAQPTVSHHLKVLRQAGVVHAQRQGQSIYYSLDDEAMDELRRWLAQP